MIKYLLDNVPIVARIDCCYVGNNEKHGDPKWLLCTGYILLGFSIVPSVASLGSTSIPGFYFFTITIFPVALQ